MKINAEIGGNINSVITGTVFNLVVNRVDLQARGGHGGEVCNITVRDTGTGKIQRFYVKLYEDRGKVSCEVASQRLNLPQDVKKRVMGAWFTPSNKE